ncbi:exodeoxyribonuclease V subunit gamma [Wohlfahrtiimonas sp. G9077]|uniref:exodeoxyribonuclease V subunit gamma n=1 Tax=Wohlfahrtiimonas sp. G9077 TaxID=1980118 RepID=UPI000B9811C4|nr:exodeoxyribonuclease V subunit gamma [Wohlfahrtiimonas sp. G9077]OYQ75733.1 exodeoxyribonuclease V subunit gamma [Wohlfahrtiimonas sp. G9077]
MAFTIYHSNHLDDLQFMASYIIKNKPLADPLAPEYFIIHSAGMTNWLKSALATEHHIFANTRLEFPINQIVTIIENLLTPEERAQTNLRMSRLTLTWAVYDALNQLDLSDLPELASYLNDKGAQSDDVRMMGLAEEIAGLFDKYLAYRPKWFAAWERNQRIFPESPYESWQQQLWQTIRSQVIKQYYLANVLSLLQTLPKSRYQSPLIPERLFIIGISTLPPLFIELLHVLSAHIDVHLFFTNPSQFYWGDLTQYRQRNIKRINFKTEDERTNCLAPNAQAIELDEEAHWLEFHGNPLLANFGKIGRDFLHILSQYDDLNEIEAFTEPTTKGLLGEVQRAVYHLAPIDSTAPKYCLSDNDRTIAFHAHYSERREVEGLYDQLLKAFNEDPTLEPKDIIVMVSDIDRYRPMIEAVFGSPFEPRVKIPFTISDFTLGKHEPILEAFLLLLSMSESQFTVSEILTLLDIPEIGEKFHLKIEDRALIKRWIDASNIRFAIDDQHLDDMHIRDDFTNTWLWGLKRLLLGYAVSDHYQLEGVRALPYVQGGDAEVLGHLADFIDALIGLKEKLSHAYLLTEWRTLLPEIWNTFYVDTSATQQRLQHLQAIWNTFIDEGLETQFHDEVSIHLMYRHLNEHLSSFRPESRFLTGSVNFCTFIPMRSIPFKIVCMLGMNQDSFPHRRQYPEYDLMQAHPERGDRSVTNDERYLFLEAILSARTQLYISYIGRNIHNNSEMFPSLFVNELQYYLDELAVTSSGQPVSQALLYEHPLSPFSPTLFKADSPIRSFQKPWLPTSICVDDVPFVPAMVEVITLTPKQLIDTFKNPIKAYSLKHFGIHYQNDQEDELSDDELFSLAQYNGLEAYTARVQLLEDLFYNDLPIDELSDYAHHTLFDRYKAEGRLPKFAFAEIDWHSFAEPVVQLVLQAKEKGCQYGAQQQVHVRLDHCIIEGTVYGVPNVQQSNVFVGKWTLTRQFEAFITHLLNVVALNQPVCSTIFYLEDQVDSIDISGIGPEEALQHLNTFFEGYCLNQQTPFLMINAKDYLKTGGKIIRPHQALIDQMYHHYDESVATAYLSEHSEFKTKIVDRYWKSLEDMQDAMRARFVPEITLKEVMGYLYFVTHYQSLLPEKPRKTAKR